MGRALQRVGNGITLFATRMKQLLQSIGVLVLIAVLSSCDKAPSSRLQGYVEGEFVYVSPPIGGGLVKMNVERGAQVKAGDVLFALESVAETAARDEATHRLKQAQATLADAKKGKRPTEIDALEAQLKQGQETMAFSLSELVRQETLRKTGAVAVESIDKARSTFTRDQQHVAQLDADLKTAALGLRSDAVEALESEVKAREAALAQATWALSQRQQTAPQAAVVDDTLYREGETVLAGRPVVALLPPANIKVRTFVPQDRLSTLHVGALAKVHVDGVAEALSAKVSFVSPHAEYTPPVIYSQENRAKFVFMIELKFDDAVAEKLHPGQPVDVELVP